MNISFPDIQINMAGFPSIKGRCKKWTGKWKLLMNSRVWGGKGCLVKASVLVLFKMYTLERKKSSERTDKHPSRWSWSRPAIKHVHICPPPQRNKHGHLSDGATEAIISYLSQQIKQWYCSVFTNSRICSCKGSSSSSLLARVHPYTCGPVPGWMSGLSRFVRPHLA